MDTFLLAGLLLASGWLLRVRDQRRRILLLARHLARFQIEKNMETLIQGYLRALDEPDADRREQVFAALRTTEEVLASQLSRFAGDLAAADAEETRMSRLPFHLPGASRVLPWATFDLRKLLAVHARGIRRAMEQDASVSPRDRAYTITAELFLMQHTCHWFCKSRAVASARLRIRHQTAYGQLLDSVLPETRSAYLSVIRTGAR